MANTHFISYMNHVYKKDEAQKFPFIRNVVILLVAIFISFEPENEI